MQLRDLALVLAQTLNPTLTAAAHQQLKLLASNPGIVTSLILICDDTTIQMPIRLSAMVYLKNLVSDHCRKGAVLLAEEVQILMDSLLDTTIRMTTEKKLLATLKEVLLLMVQKYGSSSWPNLVPAIVANLTSATDYTTLYGSCICLKALYTTFGRSLIQEISLNNLCNKTAIPTLSLVSRLFQDYNPMTGEILKCIMKMLGSAVFFHIPSALAANFHVWMIFIKKILDLPPSHTDANMLALKKICLRVLYRIYQRHANKGVSESKSFAMEFHIKYTRSFVESLLLQIINDKDNFELTRLSLCSLAYIYWEHGPAAELIDSYRSQILSLCALRHKTWLRSGSFANYTQFKRYYADRRLHFKELLVSMVKSEARPELQVQSAMSVFACLVEYIQAQDVELKELGMDMLATLSNEFEKMDDPFTSQISQAITIYVLPILSQPNCHALHRQRACQVIVNYSYISFSNESLTQIAQLVFGCLTAPINDQMGEFMRLSAAECFGELLVHQPIINQVKSNVGVVLQIYTSLLSVEISIVQSIERLLTYLQGHLEAFANELVELLAKSFYQYDSQYKAKDGQSKSDNLIGLYDDGDFGADDDDDSVCSEQADTNFQNAAAACIASVRQLVQSDDIKLCPVQNNMLLQLVRYIFLDEQQSYTLEGFNILNLVLYKLQSIPIEYTQFFPFIVYAIVGVPNGLMDLLRNSPGTQEEVNILQNLCQEPDEDFLQQAIGCLRNYSTKLGAELLRSSCDRTSTSYMNYLFAIVERVHESSIRNQCDKSIVLMIYISLVEWRILNENEVQTVVFDVVKWANTEIQSMQARGAQLSQVKYLPLYLQILFLSAYHYPILGKQVDPDWLASLTLQLIGRFKTDFELERLLIGLSNLLTCQLKDPNLAIQLLNRLPLLISSLSQKRVSEQPAEDDEDQDNYAVEERLFGEDENTQLGPLEVNAEEESDSEDEFDKYYTSATDTMEPVAYLANRLQSCCYVTMLPVKVQQDITRAIMNAPSRQRPAQSQ